MAGLAATVLEAAGLGVDVALVSVLGAAGGVSGIAAELGLGTLITVPALEPLT